MRALFLLLALAVGDPIVGETAVDVPVGTTVSLDVGYARGLQCDDLSIVRAELRAASPTSNHLDLTGIRVGRTLCRAGTLGPPTVLVHVNVTSSKR
ncbi:MAG TPA: hypothetical protein VGH28_29825 [Polyangiaceae bacterium]|jgi:hypothetical protein